MDVDDPGQDHKAAGVDHPLGARLRPDAGDDPALAIEIDAGLLETVPDERATPFDAHPHDRSELRTSGLFGPIPRLTRLRSRHVRRVSLRVFGRHRLAFFYGRGGLKAPAKQENGPAASVDPTTPPRH